MADLPKNPFDVAREVANNFVEGQPREHALKMVDQYEKLYNAGFEGTLEEPNEKPQYAKKTPHYRKVFDFMQGARQETPEKPCIPSSEVRLLRAKLIMEEALETIAALGVWIESYYTEDEYTPLHEDIIDYKVSSDADLEQIVDGCCDLKVVITGTLIACGVPDNEVQHLVDDNNLDKIERGTIREDGKLIKPPDHKPPAIGEFLKGLGYEKRFMVNF